VIDSGKAVVVIGMILTSRRASNKREIPLQAAAWVTSLELRKKLNSAFELLNSIVLDFSPITD
jgi:hypothetical protein